MHLKMSATCWPFCSGLNVLKCLDTIFWDCVHHPSEWKHLDGLVQDCRNSIADNLNGLVQDCSNSIANALELLPSCTKPLVSNDQPF